MPALKSCEFALLLCDLLGAVATVGAHGANAELEFGERGLKRGGAGLRLGERGPRLLAGCGQGLLIVGEPSPLAGEAFELLPEPLATAGFTLDGRDEAGALAFDALGRGLTRGVLLTALAEDLEHARAGGARGLEVAFGLGKLLGEGGDGLAGFFDSGLAVHATLLDLTQAMDMHDNPQTAITAPITSDIGVLTL